MSERASEHKKQSKPCVDVDMHTTMHECFIYTHIGHVYRYLYMHVKKNVDGWLMAKSLWKNVIICNRVQNATNYPRRCSLKSQLFGILFHATLTPFQYIRIPAWHNVNVFYTLCCELCAHSLLLLLIHFLVPISRLEVLKAYMHTVCDNEALHTHNRCWCDVD